MYFDKKLSDIQWCQENEDTHVSEMLLMKSAAGWYFGRICEVTHEFDDDIMKSIEPWDRVSEYLSYKEAQSLKAYYLYEDNTTSKAMQ